MTKTRFILLHVIVMLFVNIGLQAQNNRVYELYDADKLTSLKDYMYILPDTLGTCTIDSLQKIDSKHFISFDKIKNFDTWKAYWIRVTISNKSMIDQELMFIAGWFNHIYLYYPVDDSIYQRMPIGVGESFATRQLYGGSNRTSAAKAIVTIHEKQTNTYYIQFINNKPYFSDDKVKIPVHIIGMKAWHEFRANIDFWLACFIGCFVIMALFHTLFFFISRQTVYLYYVLYILLTGVSMTAFHFFLFPSQDADSLFFLITLGIAPVFYFLFMMKVIDIKKTMPRAIRYIRLWIIVKLIIITIGSILFLTTQNFSMVEYTIVLMLAVEFIVMLTLFFKLLFINSIIPRLFVFGSLCVWLGMIWSAIFTDRYLILLGPTNPEPFVGFLAELVLFSSILAIRNRRNEREKRMAQQDLINQLNKNKALQEKTTKELEEKVQQRTNELMVKNDVLAKQKNDLEEQAHKLNEAYTNLQRLDQFKENITAMIVHDLKNPLNYILNSPKQPSQYDLQRVQESGRQMLQLVNNILDVQRFEEAKIQLDIHTHGVWALIRRCTEQVSFLLEQKNVKIITICSPHLTCRCDDEIIERVMINLLTNAIKFSPFNSDIIIEVTTTEQEKLLITVSDKGKGIDNEKITTIFSKFGQADKKQSGNVASSGLGLFFCKLAVESHGEQIGIKNNTPHGASFWFTLTSDVPLERTDDEEEIPVTARMLSDAEKHLLKAWIEKLRQTEIYEVTKIRQIVKQIQQQHPWASAWCNQLQTAVYNENILLFNQLIKT